MFELVDRLVQSLATLGAPALDRRRPGLNRAELQQVVADFDNIDAQWIDDTVEAWWSWHDGDLDPGDDPWLGIAPDGLMLHSFRGVLQVFQERFVQLVEASPDQAGEARRLMFELPVVPLVDNVDMICLRKPGLDLDAPWQICTLGRDYNWLPLSADSQPVTFERYLSTLVARIEEGAMVLTGDRGVAERKEPDEFSYYPWS